MPSSSPNSDAAAFFAREGRWGSNLTMCLPAEILARGVRPLCCVPLAIILQDLRSRLFLPSAAPRRRSGTAVRYFCWCSVFLRRAQKNRTQEWKYHAAVRPEAPLSLTKGAVEGQAESAPNAGDRVTLVIL